MTAVQRVILERRVAELRTALVDQSRLRTLIFVGEHVVEHLRLTGSRLHALFATADASVPSWLIMFDEALSRLDAEQQTREEEMRRSDATVLDIRKRAHPNVDEWERQTTIVERDVAQLTASALQRSMTMTVQNAATGSLCIVLANNDAVSEAVAIDLTAQLLLWAIESQQAVTAVFGQETVSAAATVPDAVDVLEATTTADAVAIEEEEKASQAKASVSAVKKPSRRKSLLPQPGFIKPVADLSSAEASGNRRQTIASLRRRSMLPTPLAKRRPPLPPTGQPIGGKPPLPPPTVTTSTIAESHVPVRNTRRQSLLPLHRKSSRATTRSQAQKASLLGSVNELENTISDAALKQELNELDSLLAAVSTPKKQQEVDGDIFDEVPVIHMGTLSLGQNKQHALPKRLRRIANDGENQAPPTNRGKTLRQAERCVTPIMDGKGSMASASTTITVTHSPSALRHYVNHHVAMSPQVGAAPFSPARKALMERHLNN